MNTQIADLWIDALVSRKYKQVMGALREVDHRNSKTVGFCCLGVLCNLHAQVHPEIAARESYPQTYLGKGGLLPQEVQDWAGMETNDGSLPYAAEFSDLVSANDDGQSFGKIANLIRKYKYQL